MSDTFDKFKKMMQLVKENQERFEKELEKLEYEDDLKDDDATLITQEELDAAEKNRKLDEMNQQNIHELNKLRESSPQSDVGYLCDISRSLREISKSLMNIEHHLTNESEADRND